MGQGTFRVATLMLTGLAFLSLGCPGKGQGPASPSNPTRTATGTSTSTLISTATLTETPTSTLTATLSSTPTDSPTLAPTLTATSTLSSTPTETATETNTSTSTLTETFTQTPTASATSTETSTSTVTPSPSTTATPTLTETPTDTPTVTESSTPTATRTLTATLTPIATCVDLGQTGSTSSGSGGTGWMVATRIELAQGLAVSMRIRMAASNSGVRLGIYSDNAGQPGSLLASTGYQPVVTGWNDFDLPDTELVGGVYWLAYRSNSGTAPSVFLTAGVGSYFQRNGGDFPDPFGTSGLIGGAITFDLQVRLCPTGSGAPTPTSTPTLDPSCSTQGTFGSALSTESFLTCGLHASSYVLADQATVYSIRVNNAFINSLLVGIYADNAGTPGALLTSAGPVNVPAGWQTIGVPQTVLSAGTYWLAVKSNGSGGAGLYRGVGSAPSRVGLVCADTTLQNPFPASIITTTDIVAAEALFCSASSTPLPTSTTTHSPTPTPTASPVCTFGNTFIGSTSSSFTGEVDTTQTTLSAGGTLDSISIHLTAGGQVRVGIYSDVAGSPVSLIAQSAAVDGVIGWNRIDVPDTAIPAGTYWLAYQIQPGASVSRNLSGPLVGTWVAGQTFGNFPQPHPVSFTRDASAWSIYAHLCP